MKFRRRRSVQEPSGDLALNSGQCCFRFDIANLPGDEDQQTENGKLSEYPHSWGYFSADTTQILLQGWSDLNQAILERIQSVGL
ncbi:hypothetical protein IWQ52_000016 [Labrenzia sp. EL_159]|nr:hypothetical protein [Labrenzia sp. EL_162]MBG6192514.1 hypothetical protein [Labrenzia sp. EL_159]